MDEVGAIIRERLQIIQRIIDKQSIGNGSYSSNCIYIDLGNEEKRGEKIWERLIYSLLFCNIII